MVALYLWGNHKGCPYKTHDLNSYKESRMNNSPMSHPIELPPFHGPLDLLLHLIERNELDITAISLAKVAEQFLEQVALLKETGRRMEQLMDFLVLGAQLALIKSRALLPKPPAMLAQQEEEEDPAEALARRLREYKQFKEAAEWLRGREEQGWRTYLRVAPPAHPELESKLDLSNLTIGHLQVVLQGVLARGERRDESVQVAQRPTITIEGQIARLRHAITRHGRLPFRALLSPHPTRAELSVSLLAVLELTKRHEVTAEQPFLFGPIEITKYVPLVDVVGE